MCTKLQNKAHISVLMIECDIFFSIFRRSRFHSCSTTFVRVLPLAAFKTLILSSHQHVQSITGYVTSNWNIRNKMFINIIFSTVSKSWTSALKRLVPLKLHWNSHSIVCLILRSYFCYVNVQLYYNFFKKEKNLRYKIVQLLHIFYRRFLFSYYIEDCG